MLRGKASLKKIAVFRKTSSSLKMENPSSALLMWNLKLAPTGAAAGSGRRDRFRQDNPAGSGARTSRPPPAPPPAVGAGPIGTTNAGDPRRVFNARKRVTGWPVRSVKFRASLNRSIGFHSASDLYPQAEAKPSKCFASSSSSKIARFRPSGSDSGCQALSASGDAVDQRLQSRLLAKTIDDQELLRLVIVGSESSWPNGQARH